MPGSKNVRSKVWGLSSTGQSRGFAVVAAEVRGLADQSIHRRGQVRKLLNKLHYGLGGITGDLQPQETGNAMLGMRLRY